MCEAFPNEEANNSPSSSSQRAQPVARASFLCPGTAQLRFILRRTIGLPSPHPLPSRLPERWPGLWEIVLRGVTRRGDRIVVDGQHRGASLSGATLARAIVGPCRGSPPHAPILPSLALTRERLRPRHGVEHGRSRSPAPLPVPWKSGAAASPSPNNRPVQGVGRARERSNRCQRVSCAGRGATTRHSGTSRGRWRPVAPLLPNGGMSPAPSTAPPSLKVKSELVGTPFGHRRTRNRV